MPLRPFTHPALAGAAAAAVDSGSAAAVAFRRTSLGLVALLVRAKARAWTGARASTPDRHIVPILFYPCIWSFHDAPKILVLRFASPSI